jgi:lipopolysaccharide/colanic/teichoic acid biosynthesis glycosyltransferase
MVPIVPEVRTAYDWSKRALDIAIALGGLTLLAVLLPAILVGNLIANRGRLLYRQERHGRAGRRFRILKLRTMDAAWPEEVIEDWTVDDDDPRITRFGRMLRLTHVDELPQVLNVLRGQMSIVGPRPAAPRYVTELLAELPGYPSRQSVLPGITGWAQVKYGYAGDPVGAREKLQYDLYYVAHRSLGLDLRVMGLTVRTILGGRGR